MADERGIWIRNIKAVEREYVAIRFSVDWALRHVRLDPTILPGDLKASEVERGAVFLEGTYVIRLFADFETALRVFFGSAAASGRTRDLLESAAVGRIPPTARKPMRCGIPQHSGA